MKRTSLALSLSAIFLAGIFLSSCSSEGNLVVEKRHYGKGYYVHSNGSRNIEKTTEVASAPVSNNTVAAANSNAVVPANAIIENPKSADLKTEPMSVKQNPAHSKKSVSGNVLSVSPKNNVEKNTSSVSHNLFRPKIKEQSPKKAGGDVNGALLVILCIFIPFLAVFLVKGISTPFWIDLLLCLLFYLPGIIYAFIVCFA